VNLYSLLVKKNIFTVLFLIYTLQAGYINLSV